MPGCLQKSFLPFLRVGVVLSLCTIAPIVSGQSYSCRESESGRSARRFLLADASAVPSPSLLNGGAIPSPSALPEDPEPQLSPVPGLVLDLDLAPDPQFHYGSQPPRETAEQWAETNRSDAAGGKTASSSGFTPASLAQQNADFGNLSINGVDVVQAWNTVQRLVPAGVNLGATEVPIVDPAGKGYGVPGSYSWSGLLAQSLLFNVVENSFRAGSDEQIRRLLANKPFWHDWAASTKQFNMRRWNDGDDFLVNYVGHPMQGAVTGFIEIQNDPVGRELEIGAYRAYWKSRLMAFLWETAYSTHSEISPDGEAGIGNEGGWTYPIKCKTPGCPQWNPRTMHSTNNTGWVDFIITPTVGTLWLLAEDTLDRYVGDRVQGGDRSGLGSAFLRGALNPSRTMANLMRFQAPWYRDRQHDPEIENAFIVHVQPSEEQIAELGPLRRIEIAPYFRTMPVGNPANPCIVCFESPGLGIGVDIAIKRWLSVSLAAQTQGGLLGKGMKANGSTTSYEYGLRFVHTGLHSNLSLAVRPGRVIEEIPQPLQLKPGLETYYRPRVDLGHTAVTLMVSDDFKVTRMFGVRYSFGDTIVRYHDAVEDSQGIGIRPYLSWLSKDEFTNRSNWIAEAGPVVRF